MRLFSTRGEEQKAQPVIKQRPFNFPNRMGRNPLQAIFIWRLLLTKTMMVELFLTRCCLIMKTLCTAMGHVRQRQSPVIGHAVPIV